MKKGVAGMLERVGMFLSSACLAASLTGIAHGDPSPGAVAGPADAGGSLTPAFSQGRKQMPDVSSAYSLPQDLGRAIPASLEPWGVKGKSAIAFGGGAVLSHGSKERQNDLTEDMATALGQELVA